MSGLSDSSLKATEALLKETRAVRKTAKAYSGLQRTSVQNKTYNPDQVSRDMVLSFLGGGK